MFFAAEQRCAVQFSQTTARYRGRRGRDRESSRPRMNPNPSDLTSRRWSLFFRPTAPAVCSPARTLFQRLGAHRLGPRHMAKAASLKIKLLSTADTGYFYVTKKNARTKTEKLTFKKYDPVARKHVEFKETKIK